MCGDKLQEVEIFEYSFCVIILTVEDQIFSLNQYILDTAQELSSHWNGVLFVDHFYK